MPILSQCISHDICLSSIYHTNLYLQLNTSEHRFIELLYPEFQIFKYLGGCSLIDQSIRESRITTYKRIIYTG